MKSSSKASISQKVMESYMSETNGGSDPVSALSLRPSPSKSIAHRQAKVDREVAASLAVLENAQ